MDSSSQAVESSTIDQITTTREAVDTHVAAQLAVQHEQYSVEFAKHLEEIRADHMAERRRWEQERAGEVEARASRDAMLQEQMAAQAKLIVDLQ